MITQPTQPLTVGQTIQGENCRLVVIAVKQEVVQTDPNPEHYKGESRVELEYTVNRKKTGSRTFFYVTINSKRIGRTNFARKYDAINELEAVVRRIGKEKLISWSKK